MHTLNRIVLTGAGGNLGKVLRAHFSTTHRHAHVTDIRPITDLQSTETCSIGDLAVPSFAHELVKNADTIVHLAGIPTNRPLDELIAPNFLAVGNLYQSARFHGARRIIFASSNHVTGMAPVGQSLDASSAIQPDSHYGAAKAWGEAIGRMYWDKYGIETLCLRIGSCLAAPLSRRHLSTWLSHADFCRLVDAGLQAEELGFRIAYGVSRNARRWWEKPDEHQLGTVVDDSESFSEILQYVQGNAADDRWQGGVYAASDGERGE